MGTIFMTDPSVASQWIDGAWWPPLSTRKAVNMGVSSTTVDGKPPARRPTSSIKGGGSTEFAARPIAELLEQARKLGYVEQPAPNGGVRKMRVINFLKHRLHKGS